MKPQDLLTFAQINGEELKRHCLNKGADLSLAEEILQDLYLRIACDEGFVQAVISHPNPLNCLKAACWHACIDRLRRQNLFRKYVASQTAITQIEEPPRPDTLLMEKELRLRLDQSISRLPLGTASIIYLKIRHGLSFREISERLSLNQKDVANTYYAGLRKMKSDLNELKEEYV